MKILIVHQYLWTHYKAFIYSELQKIMDSDTNNSKLLVFQLAKNEKSRQGLGDVDESIHNYNYKLICEDYIENSSYLTRAYKMIKGFLKFKPDVVNICGYYEPSMLILYFFAKLFGKKVIISNDSTEDDNKSSKVKQLFKKIILKSSDGFFCYGTKSAELITNYNISSNLILSKLNAVPNDQIQEVFLSTYKEKNTLKELFNLPQYNFIYVGRFLEIKNLNLLINTFSRIRSKDWGLILLGEGQYGTDLKKLVDEHRIQNVTFLPGVSWKKVPEFLALADVLVLPSNSEPWGLVVNEAMVCEMPIIVSNKCGSAIDLVSESNGFSFSPTNSDELLSAMEFFIENPSEIKNMGTHSKEKIRNYSPKNVAKEMFLGFEKVLK
jgi:glycosyltransferase involved in cell wall biosynthesis